MNLQSIAQLFLSDPENGSQAIKDIALESVKQGGMGAASATAGLGGDMEMIAKLLSQGKQGYLDPESASDTFLPNTDSVGNMMGADIDSTSFTGGSLFGLDPTGPIGKGFGLAMPFIMAAGKRGKPVSKWGTESLGYKHDIADGTVTKKPINEMSRTVEDIGTPIDKRIMHPDELLNHLLVPLLGDRSDAGKRLTHVGENELANPVDLLGGHGFMRYNPDMLWASNAGAAKHINNRAKVGLDEGVPTSGIYMPMKHQPSNFNTMMTDAIYEQIAAGNHTQKAIKKFDKKLRETRPEWEGLTNPKAREQLHANGNLRHEFHRVNELKDFQKMGFPDAAETRFGTTDPDLMHYNKVPLHSGGQAVGRFSGKSIQNPDVPHPTYDTNIGGTYTGALPDNIPRDKLFPTWFNERRERGTALSDDASSFNRAKPVQFADQEWLDGIMKYLEGNQ
jgi:hypothetical protein